MAREQFRHVLGPLGWQGTTPAPRTEDASVDAALASISGVDIILMARPGAAELDGAQLAEVLGWLFERLLREVLVTRQHSDQRSENQPAGERTAP